MDTPAPTTPSLDVLATAEAWRKAGRDVAVATVVETWGSAPRPVGSNLVIDDQGNATSFYSDVPMSYACSYAMELCGYPR